MTDKQEIIINGVDVSGCDFLAKEDIYNSYSGVTTAYKGQCGCSDDEMCKNHRNCGYKKLARQLQRKTAECENARKRISDLENRIINHSNIVEEYCSRLADKQKECEELKKQLARYKLYEDMEDFISKHSEDTDEHLSYQLFQTESKLQTAKQALEPFEDEYFKGLNTTQIAGLAKKSIRLTTYNRDLECALDEIEDIIAKIDADECCYGDFDCENCNSGGKCETAAKRTILDIISKAKGGK